MRNGTEKSIKCGKSPGKGNGRFFVFAFSIVLLIFILGLGTLFLVTILYIDFPTFKKCVLDPEIQFSVKLSLATATITTILAMIIGIPCAYALSRFKIPMKALVDTILDLPIVLPPAVVGICLLILFRAPPIIRMQEILNTEFVYTTKGIIIAQFAVAASFGIRTLKAAFDSIDARYEQVARTLGCSQFQAFWQVTLPLARNGLIAGVVITWARAIAEFAPVLFFCGATRMKTEVMPIALFLNLSIGNIEMVVAVCIVMMITSSAALLIFKRLGGQGYLW